MQRLTVYLSRSVFKDKPEKGEIDCHEMDICELEVAPEGKGMHGLWLVKSTVYMDVSKFH
jgi:hypothetical protein